MVYYTITITKLNLINCLEEIYTKQVDDDLIIITVQIDRANTIGDILS